MIRLRHKFLIQALRIFDQAMLVGALALIVELRSNASGQHALAKGFYWPSDSIGIFLVGIGWMLIFNTLVDYETNRFKRLGGQLFDVLKATSASAFLLMVMSALFSFARINNEVIVMLWASTSLLAVISRLFIRWFLTVVRRSGYNYRHLLIVGHNQGAWQMAERLNSHPILGYKIMGFVAEPGAVGPAKGAGDLSKVQVLGEIKDLKRILESHSVDEMVICLSVLENFSTITEIVQLARDLGIVVRLFPDAASARILQQFHLEKFEGDCVITLFREQMLFQLFLKRLVDICGATALLFFFGPFMIATAIAIKVTSPGPVFFKQVRVGKNKRRFTMYKFRSMYIDAEARKRELAHMNEMDGPAFKIANDPRITPLGRFIRKMSIDELPQLFNVLSGEMSLVGPRPPLPDEVERYEWLYQRRLCINPGITCLWQISGRNEITFAQWMEMDREYIEKWSLWLDVKILLRTVPAVLSRRGAR